MADAVFSFEIEGNGDDARDQASALERLQERLREGTASLSGMNAAFRALKGTAHAGSEGFKRLKDQIAAQKAVIANSHAQFIQLGGDFKNLKKPTREAGAGFDDFLSSLKASNGPMGRLVNGLQGMKGLNVVAAGLAAIGVALGALTAGAVVATAALLKLGVAMADAYRSERLQLEGLTKLPSWFGIAASKATDLQRSLDRVSGSVALGRGELQGLQASMYQVGFRGAALEHAFEGVAIATAAAGEQGQAYARAMLGSFGYTVGGAKKAADAIKARFGGIAKAQMLSLTTQSQKLKESFAQLFSGLKIERFLEAMSEVTQLFSQNTFSGRALKTILGTVFQPIIDFVSNHGILAKRFFQGMVIGAQLLVLGVLKLRNWFRKTFGDSEILKGIDKQRMAMYAGAFVVGTLAAAFAGLAAVVAAVAVPFILAGHQIYSFAKTVYGAYEAVTGFDWSGAGMALINGLVNGIRSGAQWVIDAVRNLAGSALKAFKEKLSIASPSKVFARLGVELPRDAAVGMRAGTPALTAAVHDMADSSGRAYSEAAPPVLGPTPATAPAAPRGRGAQTIINLGGLTVNVSAKGDDPKALGDEVARFVVEKVQSMLEGVAIHMAAEVPA